MTTEQLTAVDIAARELSLTNCPEDAIWIFPDGTMIAGQFRHGRRARDHRCIETATIDLVNLDRYDKNKFWNYVHDELRLVRMVPESQIAMVNKGQQLTEIQEELIGDAGYIVERY